MALPLVVGIDLYDGTNWVSVFTDNVAGNETVLLSSLPSINFATMLVSGIRFRSNPGQSITFHEFYSPATHGPGNFVDFQFRDAAVEAVPIPAALPLFATGLAAIGLLARRRKKQAA